MTVKDIKFINENKVMVNIYTLDLETLYYGWFNDLHDESILNLKVTAMQVDCDEIYMRVIKW